MSEKSSDCVLVFVKYPVPGKVKSRLAVDIGDTAAMELYRHFVVETLTTADSLHAESVVCFSPDDTAGLFQDWLGEFRGYMAQGGGDLGTRLNRAFSECFSRGYERVVVIGSDSPDIPVELLQDAFARLHDHDVVIGPTHDGGYYLLGFTRESYYAEVFDGIPWSTGVVFAETMKSLEVGKKTVFRLPDWRDVDVLDDLNALVSRNKTGDFRSSGTMKYIKENIFPDLDA